MNNYNKNILESLITKCICTNTKIKIKENLSAAENKINYEFDNDIITRTLQKSYPEMKIFATAGALITPFVKIMVNDEKNEIFSRDNVITTNINVSEDFISFLKNMFGLELKIVFDTEHSNSTEFVFFILNIDEEKIKYLIKKHYEILVYNFKIYDGHKIIAKGSFTKSHGIISNIKIKESKVNDEELIRYLAS